MIAMVEDSRFACASSYRRIPHGLALRTYSVANDSTRITTDIIKGIVLRRESQEVGLSALQIVERVPDGSRLPDGKSTAVRFRL
jgi:hypothetical protein